MNILITGGASGLGAAITKKLALNNNTKVYFTYSKSEDKANSLKATYPNVIPIRVDFTNQNQVDALLKQMNEMDLDIIINNSIVNYEKKHFHKIDSKFFQQSFALNVLPTIVITQEAIKRFRKKKFGKIITILTAGLINTPPIGWSEYTANKAYLLSLSKSWATENIAFNITSNAISPALMQTNLTSDMDERVVEMAVQSHPLKKLLTTEEVAESVDYLVNASQQINGINLVINSGVIVI